MTLSKTYTVNCDCALRRGSCPHRSQHGPNCTGWVGEENSGADARDAARRAGRRRVHGRPSGVTNLDRSGYDLCAVCREPAPAVTDTTGGTDG